MSCTFHAQLLVHFRDEDEYSKCVQTVSSHCSAVAFHPSAIFFQPNTSDSGMMTDDVMFWCGENTCSTWGHKTGMENYRLILTEWEQSVC